MDPSRAIITSSLQRHSWQPAKSPGSQDGHLRSIMGNNINNDNTNMASQPAAPRAAKNPPGVGPPRAAGLEFVTISHPDDIRERNTRRKISRHVMKDIGASRRRKPTPNGHGTPPEPPPPQPRSSQPSYNNNTTVTADAMDSLSIPEPQQTRPRDPFGLSPITALSRHFAARAQQMTNFCMGIPSPGLRVTSLQPLNVRARVRTMQ